MSHLLKKKKYSAEPGVVFRNVNRIEAQNLLIGTPPGTYLVRPSSQEKCFALTFVSIDHAYQHGLLYYTEDGWVTDGVDGTFPTLYKLLANMNHFINLKDSEGLVPDESEHSGKRPFKTFLMEKHEFLGILFYRHSFSGLRLFRRILLHTVVFLLLIGANLFAYSMLDANCFQIKFCHEACTRVHNVTSCSPVPNLELTVIDVSGSRRIQYDKLSSFARPPPNADQQDLDDFEYCQNVRNPVFGISPVCVDYCVPEIERAFADDSLLWDLPDSQNCSNVDESIDANGLICETVNTTSTFVDSQREVSNCEGFVGLPISWVTFVKAAIIATFTLICDQVLTISLKMSQSIEWRTETRRIFIRKRGASIGAYCLAATFVAIAVVLMYLGASFMGNVPELWQSFVVGLVLSVVLKYTVFSPMRIFLWWLVLRFGGWKLMNDKSEKRAAERSKYTLKVRPTMKKLELLMKQGEEDVKYAQKKGGSDKVTAEVNSQVDEDDPRQRRRLLSSSSRRNLHQPDTELKEVDKKKEALKTRDDDEPTRMNSPGSPRGKKSPPIVESDPNHDRGAQQLTRHQTLKASVKFKNDNKNKKDDEMSASELQRKEDIRRGKIVDKNRPISKKARPTTERYAPIAARPQYTLYKTKQGLDPAAEQHLVDLTEGVDEMLDHESGDFVTSPFCCIMLGLLLLLYVVLSALVLAADCGGRGVQGVALLIAIAAIVCCVILAALFCFVARRRESLCWGALPVISICSGLFLIGIGGFVIFSMLVVFQSCSL